MSGVPLALAHESLYGKSKVYILRAFRAHEARDDQEYQLWASMSLELLGKSTLAKVHPSLVADPKHTESLFAACGRSFSPDVMTIAANTVWKRLGHLDKRFDAGYQKTFEQMSLRRNSELHSGESPFSGMTPESWEREFWGAAEVILNMQDETLDTWLGSEEARAPKEIVRRAAEALKWAVGDRIKRTREQFEAAHKNPQEREELVAASHGVPIWRRLDILTILGDGHSSATCPACGGKGYTGGIEVEAVILPDHDHEEPWTEWVETTYSIEEFACPVCGLHLDNYREVEASGIGTEFKETETRERVYEPEYGND